jgi:beta-lactamase class A
MSQTNPSIIIKNLKTGYMRSLFPSRVVEASSTIKLFIAVAFLVQLQDDNALLKKAIEVSDRHTTNTDIWSGRKKWKRKVFTTSELLSLCIVNSDASATNAILEQIGGRKKLNTSLAKLGFNKTALMRDAFSGSESQGKKFFVAKTTADECFMLLERIFVKKDLLEGKYLKLIQRTMSRVPLHSELAPASGVIFCHKTGTSLSANKLVINDIGVVYRNDQDRIPTLVVVYLSSQTFYAKYFSGLFFDRLHRFDTHLNELLKY